LNGCRQFDRLGVPRIGSGHPLICEAIGAPRNPKALIRLFSSFRPWTEKKDGKEELF